jgi:aminoglycoside 3-N-acetyltransferase
MVAQTTTEDLAAHLQAVGLRRGMDIVVHSKLIAFGRMVNAGATVLEVLRSLVGDEATIAVPTYTFSNPADSPHDARATPSTNVGVLGEYMRQLPGVVRSQSPIHSHAAIGPKAALLAMTPPTVSMGPGSDFEVFEKADFQLLLLGCKFNEGCTFLHHVETLMNVPYRAWLDLPRTVINAKTGETDRVTVRYFARRSDDWENRFDVIQKPLRNAGLMREAPAPYGRSFLARLADLHLIAEHMLAKDPYALVTQAKRDDDASRSGDAAEALGGHPARRNGDPVPEQ